MVYTDHTALCWLETTKEHSQRLIRWILRLAKLTFDISYKKGKEGSKADALFCVKTQAKANTDDFDGIPAFILESNSIGSDFTDEDVKEAITIIDDDNDEYDDNDLEDDLADEVYAMLSAFRPWTRHSNLSPEKSCSRHSHETNFAPTYVYA